MLVGVRQDAIPRDIAMLVSLLFCLAVVELLREAAVYIMARGQGGVVWFFFLSHAATTVTVLEIA